MTYDTMADDLEALLDKDLKTDRATLMGHSMGGRTALLLALRKPELVDKLFVVDISPIDEEVFV